MNVNILCNEQVVTGDLYFVVEYSFVTSYVCHHPTCHLAVLNKEIGNRDLLEVILGVSRIKTELSITFHHKKSQKNNFVLFIKDTFIW